MQRLSQSLMNIMNKLSESSLQQFLFTLNSTKVQSVRSSYFTNV